MISKAILIPKIYARLQEIASNVSKFSGAGPQTPRRRLVRGFAPLPGPPFQNSWIRPFNRLCKQFAQDHYVTNQVIAAQTITPHHATGNAARYKR